MADENNTDDILSDERGIPSVSRENNGGPGFGVVMVIFAVLGSLVLWMFWPETEEAQETLLPAQVEEEFDRERIPSFQIPDLPDEPLPLPEPTRSVAIGDAAPQPMRQMSPEELARLKAEQDLRERRKRSPLVVYDSLQNRTELAKRKAADGISEDLLSQIAAANASGGDGSLRTDKDALASQLVNREVPRVTASYLADREYIIAQGKIIGGVIETAIQSDLPGMVRAIVSETVYSEDGRNVLIEKGSRLIGEYRAGLVQGQGRIFVIWNRVITPYGVDVQITSPGTGPLGRAGHGGWIDSHFLERFGASILLSVVGAAAAQSNDDQFNVELGEGFNDSAEIALENSINIRPTLHKNQGDRIKIFVARDLNFKPVLALRSQ